MDTEAKSIAEIIGWGGGHRMGGAPDRCVFCGAELHAALRSWCPGGVGSTTVDDLLAWLNSRVGSWQIVSVDGKAIRVITSGPEVDGDGYLANHRIHDAPTLLAALEAAVRAACVTP